MLPFGRYAKGKIVEKDCRAVGRESLFTTWENICTGKCMDRERKGSGKKAVEVVLP